MKKEAILNITYISKIGFGFLTIINYIFATDNRTLAIIIPFILWIVSAIIYKSIK